MADHTWRDETETRRVYTLQSPTNWAEVSKVFAAIQEAFPDATSDNAVTVHACDDEIRFVRVVSRFARTEWREVSDAKPEPGHRPSDIASEHLPPGDGRSHDESPR